MRNKKKNEKKNREGGARIIDRTLLAYRRPPTLASASSLCRPSGAALLASGLVDANDVPDGCPAHWAVAASLSAPLLQRAHVAHAHVSARVEYTVDGALVADRALAGLSRIWWLKFLAPLLEALAFRGLVGDRVDVCRGSSRGHGTGELRPLRRRGHGCGRCYGCR